MGCCLYRVLGPALIQFFYRIKKSECLYPHQQPILIFQSIMQPKQLVFEGSLKWSEVKVTQSCPTLCDPMDYTVHGILQARILEWVAIPFSRGFSQPRDQTHVSCIAGRFFTSWTTRKSPRILESVAYSFSSRSSQPRNQTRLSCIAGGFFTNWAVKAA